MCGCLHWFQGLNSCLHACMANTCQLCYPHHLPRPHPSLCPYNTYFNSGSPTWQSIAITSPNLPQRHIRLTFHLPHSQGDFFFIAFYVYIHYLSTFYLSIIYYVFHGMWAEVRGETDRSVLFFHCVGWSSCLLPWWQAHAPSDPSHSIFRGFISTCVSLVNTLLSVQALPLRQWEMQQGRLKSLADCQIEGTGSIGISLGSEIKLHLTNFWFPFTVWKRSLTLGTIHCPDFRAYVIEKWW